MVKHKENLQFVKNRLLSMYARLADGHTLYKQEEAVRFNCSLRSIQRDFDDLRAFIANQSEQTGVVQQLLYDRKVNGYKLIPPVRSLLSNEEAFAAAKILLESRALMKKEMFPILEKMISCCVPYENQRHINEMIANEKFHYTELHHQTLLLGKLWQISQAIKEHREMQIIYCRQNGSKVNRVVKPLSIMFSEFYFYLIAVIDDDSTKKIIYKEGCEQLPTVYRIDRIKNCKLTDMRFKVPYENRFEEGVFRQRVQFMYSGKLHKVKFWFRGPSLEAILDRIPTAKVLEHSEKGCLITAEAYGGGMEMWLKSQGNNVEFTD